jgi:multiple sugar transport system ATP-binding protein
MSAITLRDVSKVYADGVTAVGSFDLTVDDGEVMVLLGPTGCGKSTVLRLIAGLEPPTTGEIFFGPTLVNEVSSRDRGISMVFQDYALYPHLTVEENIAFPLTAHNVDEAVRVARVAEVSRMLGLRPLLQRKPGQLSGGQRQRVAMARAIVRHPVAFLLDEPLSNLDAGTREALRSDVLDLVRGLGVTTIYVTHDQVEALCLADRIAVMRAGQIEQIGTPTEIYGDPQRLFVAAFVGSPRMNLLQAAVYSVPHERVTIDLGSQTLDLHWKDERALLLANHHTERITVGIRPDALTLIAATAAETTPSCLRGVVRQLEHRGHDVIAHVATGSAPTPTEQSQLNLPEAHGELRQLVGIDLRSRPVRERLARMVPARKEEPPERYAVQPAYDPSQDSARHTLGDLVIRVPVADAPAVGETVALAVDIDQLYLFDRAGDRIRLPGTRRMAPAGRSWQTLDRQPR